MAGRGFGVVEVGMGMMEVEGGWSRHGECRGGEGAMSGGSE